MNKEEFLKSLSKNLRFLSKDIKEFELSNYENLTDYNLDPIEEANKIYAKKGLNIKITPKGNFFNSVATIIKELESKNKDRIMNIVKFFLYLLFLLIILKIPFIYVRDMISNIFNTLFVDDNIYILWNLAFELLYAITTIIVFIKLINKKAYEIEKSVN